jgi:ABC-2 type transport system permease protein
MQASLMLIVCTIAGFRPHSLAAVPIALMIMMLIALVFCALGTAIGSLLQDMQGFQLVMNFLVMPIFFMSGAFSPLTNLPPALTVITRLDPLTYGVDGLRGALIASSHFSLSTDLAVLGVMAAVFLTLGAYFFSRIEI